MFNYNIHNIIKVQSEVILHELTYFEIPVLEDPDIILRARTIFTDRDMIKFNSKRKLLKKDINSNKDGKKEVKYSEHFGPIGAEFSIKFYKKPIEITINRFISLSKHVVYVNLIEPLLRFLFISKGYILLHSACMSIENNGFLLSAPPDTGKTTSVIKCVQRNLEFLSDDMTIIRLPDEALCFPKPMTISAHTFRTAVDTTHGQEYNTLGMKLRSFVHSKGGRSFMHRLGDKNVPIFTFNVLGQSIIKPPKFDIRSFLPNTLIRKKTNVKTLYFLEKTESNEIKELDKQTALSYAIENSDDAFLFPPYSELVNHIEIEGKTAKELLNEERMMLEKLLSQIKCYALRSSDRSWYKTLLAQSQGNVI